MNPPPSSPLPLAETPHPTEQTITTATEMPPPLNLPPTFRFGPFTIPSNQVFHLSASRLSFALVNIKPLLPGHILVCPVRTTPRLSQLTPTETSDLFQTVQRVSRTLERVYKASSFNVAVQDGVEAGQSVPHVHVHVIPRKAADMDARGGGDAVYEMMDGEEYGNLGKAFVEMQQRRKELLEGRGGKREFSGGPDVEEERRARSPEEMQKEALWLREEMERDALEVD